MARTSLEPFDRTRDFVAVRGFLCRGRWYEAEEAFDKDGVSVRTLRILYEARSVTYPLSDKAKPQPLSNYERACLEMNEPHELLERARGMGIRVDRRMSKVQIVNTIAKARDDAAHG